MERELRDLYYSIVPKSRYIEVQEGTAGIIISVPHGGGMKPFSIPNRKYGKVLKDSYTRRLSQLISDRMINKPYLVVSDIHRCKVDLNRGIEEAAQGNIKAQSIWKDWNDTLYVLKSNLLEKYKKVLYIDLHSHNVGDYFELGYNVSAENYLSIENGSNKHYITSLESLSNSTYNMMFGRSSLKKSLELSWYNVLEPKGNEEYFNGGRNIKVFSGNGVGAIQIECPVSRLEYNLYRVADVLSKSIDRFYVSFVANKFPEN